jgi:hypothetical protein
VAMSQVTLTLLGSRNLAEDRVPDPPLHWDRLCLAAFGLAFPEGHLPHSMPGKIQAIPSDLAAGIVVCG